MNVTYKNLLKTWCDGLIRHQITHLDDKGIFGGLICPACSIMHGRSFVAVHPLLYMGHQSGDEKYIEAAEGLIRWAEHMHCEDGSFVNDSTSGWKGITAFAAVALLESLYKYGDLLSNSIRQKLDELVSSNLEYLYRDFNVLTSAPINYLAGTAYALELGGKYKDNPKYRAKAKEYMEHMQDYISNNGLLHGEARRGAKLWGKTSTKDCLSIDIGYNVEESINFAVLYALSTGDQEILNSAVEMAKAHKDFFLPDGGWDNSFGIRVDKWTYWGSRTTDGCQPAYTLLSEYDDNFAFIAWKNAEYLSKCTHGNLLHGGRDLHSYDEPACIHHTFTHAVGLVTALEWMEENAIPEVKPFDRTFKKYYEELDTFLYSSKTWRATITGYDILIAHKPNCNPSGGALTMLYHKEAGPILSSSMIVYNRFEQANTQRSRYIEDNPLTFRMQIKKDGILYTNTLDREVRIKHIDDNIYVAEGQIVDQNGNTPSQDDANFKIKYTFEEDEIKINVINELGADIYIPIIAAKEDSIDGLTVKKGKYSVELSSNSKITGGRQIFNLVPGFQAAEYKIENTDYETEIVIQVK